MRYIKTIKALYLSVSGVAGGGGGGISDKLYVIIIFLNYFEQLLLGYIAYLLIVNHLTVLPSAQAHLVYALVYSREYKTDLILMFIMSQLRTVFFFVFALCEMLTLSARMNAV